MNDRAGWEIDSLNLPDWAEKFVRSELMASSGGIALAIGFSSSMRAGVGEQLIHQASQLSGEQARNQIWLSGSRDVSTDVPEDGILYAVLTDRRLLLAPDSLGQDIAECVVELAKLFHALCLARDHLRDEGRQEWEQILTQPEGVWIAHRDGQAVGFARAVASGAGQVRPLELEKLYVRASEYGRGTAQNLMEISIGDAPCQTWVADYNTRARSFYLKAGFTMDTSPSSRKKAKSVPGVYLERMIR